MSREADHLRNNDSPELSPGFISCAKGLGVHVFTQPGSRADLRAVRFTAMICTETGDSRTPCHHTASSPRNPSCRERARESPIHLIPMLSICGLRLFGAVPQATRGPPVSDLPIRRTCRNLANPPPGVFHLRGIVIRRLPCVGPDRQFSLCPSFLAFSVSSPMVHRASPCDVG